MTTLTQILNHRVIGTVEEVHPDRISVLLDHEAPSATALNTAAPTPFPRINGYLLIPNEVGATTCIVSSVRLERSPLPKRSGMQQDFGLVDLPFPSRIITLTPVGTMEVQPPSAEPEFRVKRGVDVLPSVGDPVHLPTSDQLKAIVEGNVGPTRRILLGHCPTASLAPVHVDPNKMFGRHLAVLGNTGSGKSCSVAGLLRWSLEAAREARAAKATQGAMKKSARPNARFIVLDPNGEYARSFKGLDARVFTVDTETDGRPLRIPAWLWNGPEWAAFAEAAPGVQRPVLFDALRRLRAGLETPDRIETVARGRIRRYRNRMQVMVQNADHQGFGKREDAAAVLLNVQTDFEELAGRADSSHQELQDALRSVAQVAAQAEAEARSYVDKNDGRQRHRDFADTELARVYRALLEAGQIIGADEEDVLQVDEDTPIPFPTAELPDHVEALAAARIGRDIAQFVDTLSLRIRGLLSGHRLSSIVGDNEAESRSLDEWLTDYVGADQASNGPIAVVDLSLVPSEIIHIVVSVLARMVFEALQRYRLQTGEELPTTLVLEEAHRFVHVGLSGESSSPAGRECSRVFERIAREGRKFGLGLVLASQRPSEVSPTVLSQCNTFLLHRIVNDRDQDLVRKLVPDGLGPLMRELPSLPTRRAILLGWASSAPTLVEIQEIPSGLRPHSPDPGFWDTWIGEEVRRINWKSLADSWQRSGSNAPQ